MVHGESRRGRLHSIVGTLDIVLRHLLQANGHDREKTMSTSVILAFAFVVFTLLLAGLALTAYEFLKISEDPSIRKG